MHTEESILNGVLMKYKQDLYKCKLEQPLCLTCLQSRLLRIGGATRNRNMTKSIFRLRYLCLFVNVIYL